MSHTLVIGYGNPLRGDDGAGWDAAFALRAACAGEPLEILTVQQLTPELAEDVSRAQQVVFIDAAIDTPPGVVCVREIHAGDVPGGFTHHCDPARLLALATAVFGRGPVQGWVATIGAERFDCEECLSASVRHALPLLVERVRELLARPPVRCAG